MVGLTDRRYTASKLAVDREVEERSVPHSAFPIEKEADRPYLADLQGALGANPPAGIPSWSPHSSGVVF